MSHITKTIFKCDICETKEEVTGSLRPHDWILFKIETLSGRSLSSKFESCGECNSVFYTDVKCGIFKKAFQMLNRNE